MMANYRSNFNLYQTSSLRSGTYSLSYVADDPQTRMTYKGSRALISIRKQSSVLIVTDKEQYKSGDDVRIHIFAVDFETKLWNLKNTTLLIMNPNETAVIVNSTNNFFIFGMYRHVLRLDNTAVSGSYSIEFTTATGKVNFFFKKASKF